VEAEDVPPERDAREIDGIWSEEEIEGRRARIAASIELVIV
jgi:hypothetical protein